MVHIILFMKVSKEPGKNIKKKKSNQISPENDDILYAKMKFSKLKSTNFDLIKKKPKISVIFLIFFILV